MDWKHTAAGLLLAAAMLLPAAQPARAQEPVTPASATSASTAAAALQVSDANGGVQIAWNAAPAAATAAATVATAAADPAAAGAELLASLAAQMPLQRYQGYDIPMQLVPMRFAGPEAVVLPQVTRLETIDLPTGLVAPGAPETPPVILADGQEPQAAVGPVALPEQPVFVLRQGWVKGEYLVMVAVSPIFAQGGGAKLATVLETSVPGASAIQATPWEYSEQRSTAMDAAVVQAAAAPVEAAAVDAGSSYTVTLVVAAPGVQRIKVADLNSALKPTPADPPYKPATLANLRLTDRGVVLPVQVVGDELRFYVESVGDRWNTNSYILVSLENDPARRSPAIGSRTVAVADAGAPVSGVIDRGLWQSRTRWSDLATYSSNFPGADGDHYFAAIFSTKAVTDTRPTLSADLTDPAKVWPANTLPLINAAAVYTLTATPNNRSSTGSDYHFDIDATGNTGFKVRDVVLTASYGSTSTTFSAVGNPTQMKVTFVPQASLRALYFESIGFARQALLNLGNRGALFGGNPGQSTYRWSNAPQFTGGYGVWDITDPAAPVALTGAGAPGFVDDQQGRRYIVLGTDFLHTPSLRTWNPLFARSMPAANEIYVIPDATFAAPLKPLIDLRNAQNTPATTVDVQRVYDAYSSGYVDPRAIRRFLQDAYYNFATGNKVRPIAVVLVGDGTYDPKNYEQRERAPTLIPPYMVENIDKYIGEAACDSCFGQLTDDPTIGENPNLGDDPTGSIFDMEMMVGRFPIKTITELTDVVSKIVSYETATDLNAAWRRTALYLADNYLKPQVGNVTCASGCPDGAGNFAAHADEARALNPNRNNVNLTPRVYFDPFPQSQTPPAFSEWWRVTDREDARKRAVAGLLDGPALVVYNGHANVFNMGELEKAGTSVREFLLGLNDAYVLYKSNQLYVQLSMTCMTAAFATPANSATTIDEGFFLWPRGGAVAVWGSSGQSLVKGHESLQKGFFGKLFQKPGTPVRLGDLMDAGYTNLTLTAPGNDEVLRTFLLLGDPLTKLRYNVGPLATYIPLVDK